MSVSISLRHRLADFTLDVAFDAPSGVTVLFGPSGSGKSTVLNAVAGLLRPDAGKVAVGDTVLTDTAQRLFVPPHRRRLGVIFQDGRLFPHLSVQQNLRYGRWFSPASARRIPESAVVEMLGIGALLDRAPATLSGGERQRVAIGRALLADPRLILADEPLSALDDDRKGEILPYLERLRDEWGVPMLYVSHSPAEVARIATTVVMLDAGRITRIGPAAEVLADPATAGPGREAGAVIEAQVIRHHDDGVTELAAGGLPLFLPTIGAAPGARLRLRIAAPDVMLARGRPTEISALNILPGMVESLTEQGGQVLVRLSTPAGPVLSRITRRSAAQLGVAPGEALTAVVKSVSHAPADVGRAHR